MRAGRPLPPGAGQSALVGERPVHRAPQTWRARRMVVSAIVDLLPRFPRAVQELGSSGPRNRAMSNATRGAGTHGRGRGGLEAAFSWRWAESRWLSSEEGDLGGTRHLPLSANRAPALAVCASAPLNNWLIVGVRAMDRPQNPAIAGLLQQASLSRCPGNSGTRRHADTAYVDHVATGTGLVELATEPAGVCVQRPRPRQHPAKRHGA